MKKMIRRYASAAFMLLLSLFASCELWAQSASENVISLKTSKEIGETLSLRIAAEGEVSFEGISGTFQNDDFGDYEINKQEIILKGSITKLICNNSSLSQLDVSRCTSIATLFCADNQLTEIKVAPNSSLASLNCSNNQIKGEKMDALIASLPDRQSAEKKGEFRVFQAGNKEGNICTKEQVQAARARGWIAKEYTSSGWSEYEGSETEEPEEETPESEQISLKTAKNIGEKISLLIGAEEAPTLSGIEGEWKKGDYVTYTITDQNISIQGSINEFDCSSAEVTELDVTQAVSLTNLGCALNKITQLDVSQCVELTDLFCFGNAIASIDLKSNTQLVQLLASHNQFSSLDISKCVELRHLDITENQISSIDLTPHKHIESLLCANNLLSELNLNGKEELLTLDCRFNKLSSLDLSPTTSLDYLACAANQIKGEKMTALINSLPSSTASVFGVKDNTNQLIPDHNECSKEQVALAAERGWLAKEWDGDSWVEYGGTETGIDDIATNSLTLYPNASKSILFFEGGKVGAIVCLYSINGTLLAARKTNDCGATQLPIGGLPQGVYVVRVGKSMQRIIL